METSNVTLRRLKTFLKSLENKFALKNHTHLSDSELSTKSTNPVENSVITKELNKKADSKDIPTSLPANGGNADTVNGHTVKSDVPENAVFTDTTYSHPTTSGNKHIPSGGSSGQILRWSADGTAVWGQESTSSVSDDVVTTSKNVNGCIIFTGNDGYGLRTARNNYGRIGESGKQFYEVHAQYLYENGTKISNKYLTGDSPVFTGTISSGRKDGTTSGTKSVALGYEVEASGDYSHAEGYNTKAISQFCHTEGNGTTASDWQAHAEGCDTTASKGCAHAEGHSTIASGYASHSEGQGTRASGDYSHAAGYYTIANQNQYVIGHHNQQYMYANNASEGAIDAVAFSIGNGTTNSDSNAFRIQYNGKVYAKSSSISTGADYAEYFEWEDGNENNEDRRGYFVTLNGEKIKIATSTDYILGIVSGFPSVIGNGDEEWRGRYVFDEFDAPVIEEFEYETQEHKTKTNDEGEIENYVEKVKHTGTKWKEVPEYDPSQTYIPRDQRKEWSAVGMLGILAVRDDGTCKVNGFCKVTDKGIATASESGYRVIKRVNNNIIKTVFK